MTSAANHKLGIIGAGIMGEALLASIIKSGIDAANIAISDKRGERTAELSAKYGCEISSAENIASSSENIILVVKPQDVDSLLKVVCKSPSLAL